MRRILYLVTSARPLEQEPLFVGATETTQEPEVVLLQDAVRLRQVPVSRVSVLDEDLRQRGGQSPFPMITYHHLLEKIFSADHVVRI